MSTLNLRIITDQSLIFKSHHLPTVMKYLYVQNYELKMTLRDFPNLKGLR